MLRPVSITAQETLLLAEVDETSVERPPVPALAHEHDCGEKAYYHTQAEEWVGSYERTHRDEESCECTPSVFWRQFWRRDCYLAQSFEN